MPTEERGFIKMTAKDRMMVRLFPAVFLLLFLLSVTAATVVAG